MTPYDAQASLDSIRRLQDRSIDEYVGQSFARPAVLVSALAVFVVFASFDLPDPWDNVAVALGLGLSLVPPLVQQRRASVHRRPTGLESLFCAVASMGIIVAYVAFQIAAVVATWKLGLPAHHTVAAAATALTIVATAGPARRVFRAVVRHGVVGPKGT